MKCDCNNGSIINGIQQPILHSFILNKIPGFKFFCEPETIPYKKINNSILNSLVLSLEDDNNDEVNFN